MDTQKTAAQASEDVPAMSDFGDETTQLQTLALGRVGGLLRPVVAANASTERGSSGHMKLDGIVALPEQPTQLFAALQPEHVQRTAAGEIPVAGLAALGILRVGDAWGRTTISCASSMVFLPEGSRQAEHGLGVPSQIRALGTARTVRALAGQA